MSEVVKAKDLHAGDWIERELEDRAPARVEVLVRGRARPDGTRSFVTGCSKHARQDLELAPNDTVNLLSRWPELPEKYKIS